MIFHYSGIHFHLRHLCFSFLSLICDKDTGFISLIVSVFFSYELNFDFFYVDYILSLHADTHHNPRSLRIDYSWPQYLFEGHLKTPNRPVKASRSAKSQKHAERE